MRVFFALDVLGRSTLDKIAEFQRRLMAIGGDVKPTARENIHFTLLFIGETDPMQVEEIKARMQGYVFAPVNVHLQGAGYFPGGGRINVIWIGADRSAEERLTSIHNDLAARLEGVVPFDHKPFRAHLTIARVKSSKNKEQLINLINQYMHEEFGSETLVTLKLKSSTLTPAGPIYTDIANFYAKVSD